MGDKGVTNRLADVPVSRQPRRACHLLRLWLISISLGRRRDTAAVDSCRRNISIRIVFSRACRMGFRRSWLPAGKGWCSSLAKRLGTYGRTSSAETAFLSRHDKRSGTLKGRWKRPRQVKRHCGSADLRRGLSSRERNRSGYSFKRIL